MSRGLVLAMCTFVLGACNRNTESQAKTLRLERSLAVFEDAGAPFAWRLSHDPDIRFGAEWKDPEVSGDAKQAIVSAHRWMGQWGTLNLRVPSDAGYTLVLQVVSSKASPLHPGGEVTVRVGNEIVEVFSSHVETELVERAVYFSQELIRRNARAGWLHVTLESPTCADPGERGYKAYGLALKGIRWRRDP